MFPSSARPALTSPLACALGALAALAFIPTGFAANADPALRPYRDFATRNEGNPARGRELFFRGDKAACALCHSIDGSHAKAGPDLATVGDALGRSELIDAVLEPNAAIAVGYEATLVETHSGATYHGVIKAADATALELMGVDGVRVRVPRSDVKAVTPSTRSLMPDGLHATFTVAEFADVIAFLTSLRETRAAAAAIRGMPNEIPSLARPVELRPILTEATRFAASVVQKPGDVRLGLVWCGGVPRTDALLAAHQSGTLWLLEPEARDWKKTPFADLSAEVYSRTGPNGLLGVAFHPQFATNRKYYVKHQVFEAGQIVTTVVERLATPDGRRDSGKPSRRILALPCTTQNHTGGCIAFGPDGCLYVGMGDTGPQRDPNGHGQDRQTLLGKLLRLDVNRYDATHPYSIPQDNPFVGRTDTRPEIWALGFREPWRFSFDARTGELWVGDVGQDRVEEVTLVHRGENHGWNVFEGFEPFSSRWRVADATYVPPVFAYKRRFGNSITGGFVYRADEQSSFYGVYVCGDYTSKRIWGLLQERGQLTTVREIARCPESIASFGTDALGNLYVVGYEGMIYQLELARAEFDRSPTSAEPSVPAPRAAAK